MDTVKYVNYYPCSVANLYSSIFGIDLKESFAIVGLELCPFCGEASRKSEFFPYCNKSHYIKHNNLRGGKEAGIKVSLVCDMCGVSFKRKISEILSSKKWHDQQRYYCSRQCFGRYAGKNYGFGIHPENTRGGHSEPITHCKRGHLLIGSNIYAYIGKNGYKLRQCRLCQKIRAERRKLIRAERLMVVGHGVCGKSRKWDYQFVWEKHLDTGFGAYKLGNALGIPIPTVSYILKYCRNKEKNEIHT